MLTWHKKRFSVSEMTGRAPSGKPRPTLCSRSHRRERQPSRPEPATPPLTQAKHPRKASSSLPLLSPLARHFGSLALVTKMNKMFARGGGEHFILSRSFQSNDVVIAKA